MPEIGFKMGFPVTILGADRVDRCWPRLGPEILKIADETVNLVLI
jgi:hypothetical protein